MVKACPFCGSKAGLYSAEVNMPGQLVITFSVWCTKCDIHTENYLTREKAIERWNRRIYESDTMGES